MSLADFSYERATKIVFGKNKVEELGALLQECNATRVLLTYGFTSIKKLGLYDIVTKVLNDLKIPFWELSGIRPNPEVSKSREGIKIVRDNNIDFILAVGGGSVIDQSKSISYGHGYEGDVWEIISNWWTKEELKKDITITKFLPIGTILTLSATGSEFNSGSVISNDETGQKLGCLFDGVIPKFSILDPQYTYTVSKYQTRAGSIDILSHVLEYYFGNDDPFLTQRLTEAVIKTVLHYLPIALKDPKSYEARSNLMWASSIALSGYCGSGRAQGDWSNHAMEHECAAIYPKLTHGIGLGICTVGWMRYVVKKRTDKFLSLGKNCFGMKDVTDAEKVIDYFENYLLSVGCPVYWVDEESTKTWTHDDSEKAAKSRIDHFPGDSIGSFVKLSKKDIVAILDSRIKRE